ncbi:TylF/MycF/NovP-related O-methyltransferase [Nocardia sp. NPDC051321]|uniref:TylF/MycF/NovP-related O-methyltransferase n=1 Tax=Nocardia sp. NPDC051321 TaxID=3364323 RepID=UPI00378E7D19
MKLEDVEGYLLDNHSGTTDEQRLATLKREISALLERKVAGAFVEVGCYRGATAAYLRALLDLAGEESRPIHVYDSFEGLPEPDTIDGTHLAAGSIRSCQDDVIALHRELGLAAPIIHSGWFHDTLPAELPDTIAFGYLDGDFYESILTSLRHCVPNLAPGGLLIVDDYADVESNPAAWNGLPGVLAACEAYFGRARPLEVLPGSGDLAFGAYRT